MDKLIVWAAQAAQWVMNMVAMNIIYIILVYFAILLITGL